jgi:hypothetical protein
MGMSGKLEKTSVQLAPEMLRWMDAWPGVSRSEAIRLALERTEYLSSLKGEEIANLVTTYEPILAPALEDFWCEDFRTVARALPAIVGSFIQENGNEGWTDARNRDLDTADLHKKLQAMHPVERIHLLDCVVARRHQSRSAERGPGSAKRRRHRFKAV